MKTIYMIKELCPMWSDGTGIEYKVIKPYVFINKEEAEQCRVDYEYISVDRVLCTEYELISLEIEDVEILKEINVEGKLINIRGIIDNTYEDEFRYSIHKYKWLESAGRINYEEDEYDFNDWIEPTFI